MSSGAVIDASVAIRIVRLEPGWDRALDRLRTLKRRGGRLLVPAFFWLEIVNVLGRRYRLMPPAVLESIADLEAMALETVDIDRPMLLLALDAVARHGLTAYDAAYLALADAADARLMTADARLAVAAGARAEFVGEGPAPHQLAEAPAAYTTSWADWPGAAAYLRQLRARVASS